MDHSKAFFENPNSLQQDLLRGQKRKVFHYLHNVLFYFKMKDLDSWNILY